MSGRMRRAWARLLSGFQRRRLDRELDEELAVHLELAADDLVRQGASPEEARRRARWKLGGLDAARELHREARGFPMLDRLLRDLRYSLRTLRRDPSFASVAVLVLAIGIGANTTVWSLVHAILLRPLPFADADRLVWISNHYPGHEQAGASGVASRIAVLEEWRLRARAFSGLSGYFQFFGYDSHKLTGDGEPERLVGVPVAQDFFELLGVRPHLGRGFADEECRPDGPRAVLLSQPLWQRRFASDPAVVGRSIVLDEEPVLVAGVMPASLDFGSVFAPGVRVDLFTPLVFDLARNWGNTVAVVGRLAPGATLAGAQADLDAINGRLGSERPDLGRNYGARVVELQDHVAGRAKKALAILLVAVALVLLIACANLSSLMLTRAASRQKEIALRAALGAGRGGVVRQLLLESLLLSSAGGLLGLLLAWVATHWLAGLEAISVPRLAGARIDGTSLAFTALAAAACAVLFGLAPGLQLSRPALHEALKLSGRGGGGGPRRKSIRGPLVVAETALACVLLVGAGLLLRSLVSVLDVPLGFEPQRSLTLRLDAGASRPTPEERYAYFDEVVARVLSLPGVEAAGVTDALPLDRDRSWGVRAKGAVYPEGQAPMAHVRLIGPGYFEAMGIPLHAGRDFGPADTRGSEPVVIVNETLGRRLWPDRGALEQVLDVGADHRVVGVAGDVRHSSLEEPPGLEIYLPMRQLRASAVDLVVRATLPLEALAPKLRAALRSLDATLPVTELRPLRHLVDRAVSPRRFLAALLGGFAAVALGLAAFGTYGLVAYGVSQRTQEIGVRMALGASAGEVRLGVLRQTLLLALAGTGIGLAAALVVAQALRSLLFEVSTADPVTFAGIGLLLIAVACLSGYFPARRASRVHPIQALRSG